MAAEISPGKPTTCRYTPAEKEQAVRLVGALRVELGTEHGTVQRIARQLGYGVESVRSWMAQPTSMTAAGPWYYDVGIEADQPAGAGNPRVAASK